MFIQSESGLLINLNTVEEIGLSHYYETDGVPGVLCDLVAFGVGRPKHRGKEPFADDNRYIVQQKRPKDCYEVLDEIADAIRDGRHFYSALDWWGRKRHNRSAEHRTMLDEECKK